MNSPFTVVSRFKQLRNRLQTLPLPETEESILLRIVTQILVVVGIVATDVAAGTQLFVWAVPLSLAGGLWSWWRRKKRNVAVKFVLAIGMFGALLVFFGNLIENINDTRLVLAELLIHAQILHSFHMPRRRDLGYSMVIGLILLAVAGTLSETLAFGPFIVLFLAIALPSLLLDYRSRLGLLSAFKIPSSPRASATVTHSSNPLPLEQWSRLILLFVLILGLGLTFSITVPRSSGYQLQSFPVNAPGDFENFRFEGEDRSIINPGTTSEDDETGEGGTGTAGEGEGLRIYYGFDQSFDQSQPPEPPADPIIVMRVRSQAPGFWRVLGFDRYTGTGWEMSRDDQTVTQRRPSWTYRFALSLLDPPQQSEPIIQTYSIAADMPNLLPALSHPTTLYFSTPEIATDPENGLRSPAALTQDVTYTVISNVPVRDRQRLGQASTLYPERVQKYYLQLPDGVAEAVRPIAEELLSTASTRPDNPYEIALFLAQALKQNYQINPDILIFPGMDLTTAFLSQKGGYPDQFSTVLTVMLRSLGIPARMAAGFAPGEFNPFTGFYVVRNTDAFFLTEVYFPNQGWYSFDPIPGHEVVPPSYVDNETFGVVRQAWNWVASWLPSPVRAWLTTAFGLVFGSIIRLILWLWQWMSSSLVGFLIGLIGLTGFSFAAWFAALNVGRWWRFRRLFRRPPMERLYRQMLLILETKGDRKPDAQTPLEYAYACQERYPAAIADPILHITNAYLQWRYNQQAPTDLDQLQAALRIVQKQSRLTFS